jgi:RNAse (barnase) inhibitor barstar
MAFVRLDTKQITDWASFHLVCKEAFGFPDYYGENMNAWIDCISDLIEYEEVFHVEIAETEDFKSRLTEIFHVLIECTAFVNSRFDKSRIALIFL